MGVMRFKVCSALTTTTARYGTACGSKVVSSVPGLAILPLNFADRTLR